MQESTTTNYEIAKRPTDRLKTVNTVKLQLNFYRVIIKKKVTIHYYSFDVFETTRKPAGKKASRKVYEYIRANEFFGSNIISFYDGGPIYSTRQFEFDHEDKDLIVNLPAEVEGGRNKSYRVKIRYQGETDLGEIVDFTSLNSNTKWNSKVQSSLSLLNAALNYMPKSIYLSQGRRSIYPDLPQFEGVKIPGGFLLKTGIQQALRPGWNGLVVNIDRSSVIFYLPGPLIKTIPEVIFKVTKRLKTPNELKSGLNPYEFRCLEHYLKGVKLEITSYGRHRTITANKLSQDNAARLKINRNDQNSQTIQQYFKARWGYDLQYPCLPCIGVYNQRDRRYDYFPIEVCEIVKDQKFEEKDWKPLPEDTRREVVRKTCFKPIDTFKYIQSATNDVYKHNEDEILKSLGIEVEKNFIKGDFNIMPGPKLHTADNPKTIVENRWNTERFLDAKEVINWSVIVFDRNVQDKTIKDAMELLKSTLMGKGMKVPHLPTIEACERARFNRKRKPDLIICIISKNAGNPNIYGDIKRCEAGLGVLTQCILSNNINPRFQNKWQSTFNNLALKINGKLGGENARLSAGRSEKDRPSVTGVCASTNNHLTKYAARSSVNSKIRNETIENLQQMTVELLEVYRSENNRLPDHIIVYRDGVSETHFQNVKDEEITKLKVAFDIVYSKYNCELPKLTFVIVQKRHHTKSLALDNNSRKCDRNQNCLPGTVIDKEIVVPQNFEFFLYSHLSPLGTSKPAHYFVILNEGNFSSTEMYHFTYRLCFLSSRCNLSVSHVIPVYYAHHLVNKAKHLETSWNDNSSSSSRGSSRSGVNNRITSTNCIVIHDLLKNTQHFI
ncbi:17729_t:CDS:10 [Entrophospora sp. SA101]|nr:17729_t:CDS:10 [Entrophospora sp. SA101]CAJ0866843.1 20612_t:CDS:10 [Entrophospora sp. SA101]